jgi:putative intracellular protease/amidase
MAKVLMLVTSHGQIDTDHPTGLWFEEYAAPLRIFRDAACDVVTASPKGGRAPVDPRSLEKITPDPDAMSALEHTHMLMELDDASSFDAVFVPGGHGTMWDLATHQAVKTLISEFDVQGKIIAAVCHGPAAFVDAIRAGGSATLVEGRRITCFTNSEERAVGLDKVVPFLLASKLREQGANVVEGADWADHVEVDGNFITGQNPQSSASTARAVVSALKAPLSP